MRAIRVSKTYLAALHKLLAYGETRFGSAVVDDKRAQVDRTIEHILSRYPGIGRYEAGLGVYSYAVRRAPFVLLYEFDDAEVRIHLVIHARADRSRVALDKIEW